MSALPGPLGADDADADVRSSIRRLANVPSPVAAVAFWLAVVLPFLYVPLLVTGAGKPGEREALAMLILLDAVALYLGHGHRADQTN